MVEAAPIPPQNPFNGASRGNGAHIPFYSAEIDSIVNQVSRTDLYNYLLTLQNFGPRVTGNPAFIASAAYILDEMNQTSPLITNLDYFNIDKMNVVGVLPGLNASNNEVLVMGAHFDSVAAGPGADDDASGTAAVLEAAEVLQDYRFERTIVFCAFGGEEQGLHGSKHYAQNAYARGDNIIAMLNYDMIGYTGADQLPAVDIIGNNPSRWLVDYQYATNVIYQNGLYVDPKINPGMTASDHAPFWTEGYDAIYNGEDWGDPNPYYHKATDTIDKLNMYLIKNTTMNAVAMLAQLAGRVDKVVINEIMLNSQTEEDWVELYNTGEGTVNITGWELTDEDGNIYTIPDNTYLPSDKYLTVHWGTGIDDSYFGEHQPNSKHLYTQTPSIFEDIDQCALYFNNNHSKSTIIDFVAWGNNIVEDLETAYNAGQWDLSIFVDTTNFKVGDSLGRTRDSNDTDKINDWELTCGADVDHPTPGAPNIPIVLKNEFIGLLNGYIGSGGQVCFANYTDYNFQVEVISPNGLNDLNKVALQFEPQANNLTYLWDANSDTFIEAYDPNNFAEIVSDPGDSVNNGIDTWSLDFRIIFNWSYPNENFTSCRIHSISDYGFEALTDYPSIFQVENDLEFIGELSVHSEDNLEVQNGNWVRSSTNLTWTGLKVVYEHTENIYPHNDEFGVALTDDDGELWYDPNSSSRQILIRSVTDPSTDFNDLHHINITGIPASSDSSNITFEIKVDSDGIIFHSPTPHPVTWQNRTNFECGIKINDINGSGVWADSVDYRILTEDALGYTGWTNANITQNHAQINCSVWPTFAEGVNNYIQWRGKDLAGNGYELSDKYQLKIDLTELEYINAYPTVNDWQTAENVIFDITITDLDGSGVNGSTIEFRVTTQDLTEYGSWLNAGVTHQTEIVQVSVSVEFDEGDDNYIQFRSKDLAGNGYTLSPDYQVRVNTTDILPNQPPDIIIDSPRSGLSYPTSELIYFDGFNTTDPDNDVLEFKWASNISGHLGNISRFYALLPEGLHNITLTVNDGHDHSVSDCVEIELDAAEDPPIINLSDQDNDGMNDGWEVLHGLDPSNPEDAVEDEDGDGLINFQEFLLGSDPTDSTDPEIIRHESEEPTDAGTLAMLGAIAIILIILIIVISILIITKLKTRRPEHVMKPQGVTPTIISTPDLQPTTSPQPEESAPERVETAPVQIPAPLPFATPIEHAPTNLAEEPASRPPDDINAATSAEPVEGNEE